MDDAITYLRTYRPYATVQAFQVTDALFEDIASNPNPVTYPRIEYDIPASIVWVLQASGKATACELGDWVVFTGGGQIMRVENAMFIAAYGEVGTFRQGGDVGSKMSMIVGDKGSVQISPLEGTTL